LIFQFDIIYHESNKREKGKKEGGTMKILRLALSISLFLQFVSFGVVPSQDEVKESWSWLLYRTFTDAELEIHKNKSHIVFAKESVSPFTQLIFSWNALRPEKGYFSFLVSAHDSKTNQWGSWHHMIDWGIDIAVSYASKSDGIAHYNFVCLKMEPENLGDGFRIKAVAHDGACLSALKACAVSLSDDNKFKAETADHLLSSLSSVHIRNVPTISQFDLSHPKNKTLCSPTSCSMLTSFLSGKQIDPIEFASKAYDNGLSVYGSWPFNMAHAFEVCDGRYWFFTSRLNSFAGLHARLKEGVPVVVSIRGPLVGAALPHKNGHLLTVVGYDTKKQEVIVHDPAWAKEHGTVRRYALKHFLEAWERSRRLTYLAQENQLFKLGSPVV